jgi:hypothetical protein
MVISVFLSATCKDLANDCRPRAREAIELANAKAITMETWDTDYLPAVDVCHGKIRDECSHYLGIFAYRRGGIPASHSKSITELEFDWAFKYKKPIAIFMPDHTSPFALELKHRAKDQSQEDKEAQLSFLTRVREFGLCIIFKDLTEMSTRIGIKVKQWSEGGRIRQIARQTTVKSPDNGKNFGFRITENDTLKIGRKIQLRQFEDTLDKILDIEALTATCFLILGEPGFGHLDMIKRLHSEVENRCAGCVKRISFSIDALWRLNNLTELKQIIGTQIHLNQESPSVSELASRLKEILASNDVVIEIQNLQRLNGSIKEFQDFFWKPLVKALGNGFKNQLIVLLSFEGTIEKENELELCDPSKLDNFQNHSIVVLDELKEFTQSELKSWLRKWYPPEDAQMLSGKLILESRGGFPQLLYYKLEELGLK